MASDGLNCDGTRHNQAIVGHSSMLSDKEQPICFDELYANAPNMMVCFKRARERTSGSGSVKSGRNSKNKSNEKRAKSRELRASILYVGCDCEKRNGLQDQCPRSQCQGQPQCLTKPPTCPPCEFAGAKHLERKTELFLKRKREALKAKKAKEAMEAEAAKRAKEKEAKEKEYKERLHYDCVPIDRLVNEGDTCPVCSKPLDFVEVRYRKPILNMEDKAKYFKEGDCCDWDRDIIIS